MVRSVVWISLSGISQCDHSWFCFRNPVFAFVLVFDKELYWLVGGSSI